MKYAIVLTVLFTIICSTIAHEYEILFQVFYDSPESTIGKLAVTLNGETEKKTLVAEELEFFKYESRTWKTEFPEDVLNVSVTWESQSKKPLLLLYLTASKGDEHANFLMTKDIESATTEVFERST